MNEKLVMAVALGALAFAGGCASSADITAAPTRAPRPPPAAIDSPVGSASAAGSTGPAGPAPEVQSDLVAVATLPYDVSFLPFDGGLVAVGAQFDEALGGIPMGVIESDRFTPKPELAIRSFWATVVGAGGAWPQGVDMVVTGTTGRTAIAMHYTLSSDAGWVPKSSRDAAYFAGIATVGASVLALETPAVMPYFKPEVKTLRGPKLVRTTAPVDTDCERELAASGHPRQWLPRTAITPVAFGATRGGTLVALGPRACGDGPTAEIWDAGSTTSRLVDLPAVADPKLDGARLVVPGRGEGEAYLVYGSVSRLDGQSLTRLPDPPARLEQAAVGGNGTLYAIVAQKERFDEKQRQWVLETPPRLVKYDGKAWSDVPLPTVPFSVAADRDGTVWVSTGSTLLRTRRGADEKDKVTATKAEKPAVLGVSKRRAPRAAGPLCPSNLVVLYGFTKVTPEDYDFPLTRKALKGHTEYEKSRFVVAKDGGQKFFSAIVPDVAAGRKLVSLIEKEVKGSKPQLLCAEPEVVREVKIDLRTGEVVK